MGLPGNPCARLRERFRDNLHVMAAGVQQMLRVPHHADMALPEHKIAALQNRPGGERRAEFGLLHVGVAGRGHAGSLQGDLHEARSDEVIARVNPLCLNFCSVTVLLVSRASKMSTFLALMLRSPPGASTSLPTCL